MPRFSAAVHRISDSLGRDLAFVRKQRVSPADRVSLTAEKYKGRVRGALGRSGVHDFAFNGMTVHATTGSDAALLQRVVTETYDVLKGFGLLDQEGVVAVDVGAHNGETALALAFWLDAPTIHSFEANPESAKVAARNLEPLGATLHAVGLGAESGTMPFDAHRGSGGDASFVFHAADAEHTFDVEVARGDDVLPDISPDWLKIDVEGFEWNVLQGLRGTLSRTRFLSVEMSLDRQKDHQYHQVAALLAELRFELMAAGAPHLDALGRQTAIDLHYRRHP